MAAPSPLDAVPGTLYRHYRDVDTSAWRWQHFSPWELACKHCGELFLHVPTLDYLERYRRLIDAPARLNSTHRCPVHNARIGGAPASCHKRVAADISTRGRDRGAVMRAARAAGARGIGYYAGFLHTDLGRRRSWFGGQEAKRIWQPLLTGGAGHEYPLATVTLSQPILRLALSGSTTVTWSRPVTVVKSLQYA